MAKKFVRIALAAFVLCVALALTSVAYETDVFGRVTGLEDGVDYTYAQYDFAANAYGEFAELTADTALTAGVWGIKAGDAEPEALFVSGTDSGYVNWYSNETGLFNSASFGGKVDGYVPGKWTVNKDGIFRNIGSYQNKEIILWAVKSNYQNQVQVAKTVTVEEEKYPVYAVGETEYYLKDGAYYAVADNTLYEGEDTPVEVTVGTWLNATPIIDAEGENNNRLQESVISYGFANNQVVPASKVIELGFDSITSQAGGMISNTKADGSKYTKSDVKGTFTWVVKSLGSEEETRYTVDIDATQKVFTAPAEMAESNGYLVAIEFAPYAYCPDDIFVGHPTDGSIECYAYINPAEGRNAVEYTATLPEAPAVQDGYGTIYVEPTDYYVEIAPVTLGEDGTVFTYGEWTDYEYDIAATRDMVGLYAVRGYNGNLTTEITYAYAYGEKEDRAYLGKLQTYTGDPPNDRVAVTGGTDDFVAGTWTGKWINAASISTHSTFGVWYLGTLGGQVSSTQTTNLKNALAALAELKAAETPDEDAIAAQEKTVLGYQTTIANNFSDVSYKYSFESDEIIKASEAGTFAISYFQNNGIVIMDYVRTRVIAYVADRNGEVTTYTKTFADIAYTSGKTINQTINFADFLPEEGWLVGLEIYPSADIAPEEVSDVRSTGNIRWLLRVDPAHYTVGDAAELPMLDGVPSELYSENGVVKGFKADALYAWAPFNLNGYTPSDWTAVPAGTTELEFDKAGMVAVKYISDGYSHNGSVEKNLFLYGTSNNIYHVTTKNTTTQKTVTVDGTAYNVFTIDGVEYYLKSVTEGEGEEAVATDKYFAVADNAEYTGENAASAAKVFTTKNVPDVVYLSNTTDNLVNVKFNEGKWSGIAASNALALDHGYSSGCIGCTDTPISSTLATAIQTAVNSGDATAIAEARAKAAANSDGIYYSYAFLPEEVIKMAEFESFKVRASKRQGGFSVVGSVQTKVVLKVVDANGILTEKSASKTSNYDWTGSTHTFTRDDFGVAEGYIVGIIVYPYVLTEGSYLDYVSKTNGDYDIYVFADGFKAERKLDAIAQPTGITFDGNKISGLDANLVYEYGHYSIAGDIGEWTTITSATELIHELTGLVGIRIKGDGKYYDSSLPVVGYVAGSAAARAEIGNVVDSKPVYDTSRVDTWKTGIWTGDYLSWHDQTTGAYAFLDQNCGVSATDVETLWLYQNTKEYVLEKLAADAENTTLPAHWVTNKVTSNPDRLKGVVEKHYAAADYAETLEANKLALQTKVANAFATRNIKYAFDETEILPVEELVSMSFTSKKRQGGFIFTDVKSKAVIHVMDSNANVTAYEWWSDSWAVPSSGVWKKITVDVQSIEDLPEEGWVVGVEFYPWAEVEPSGITAVTEARIDASSVGYSFGQQHVCIGYYPAEYVIAVAAPELSFDAETGIVSGFEADKTYQYAPFSINGMGDATSVEAGAATLQLTEGLWAITEVVNGIVSKPVVVYYRTDRSTMTEIGTIVDEETYKHYDYVGGDVWEQGKWSGLHLGVHSTFGSTYAVGTLGGHIWSAGAKALYEATDDTARAAAIAQILGDANAVNFRYAYANDEIVEAKDLLQIAFKTVRRMGSLTLGQGTAEVVFYIADETGAISQYTWSERYNAQSGNFTVVTSDIENWPSEGWVVGFQIKPWQDLDPDGLVCTPDVVDGVNKFYSTMCTMTFVPTSYKVVTGEEVAEVPTLNLTSNNNIQVTNYNSVLTYVYSADGGKTWTEFEGSSFTATKINTEYQVKSLASYPYEESEVATVTSRPIAVVGVSLILDGRIGTKVYLEVDETLVDPSSLVLYSTKVNSDYNGVEGMESVRRVHGNSNQKLDWMSKGYDEEKGLYFFTVYVPAKDADNTTFETELHYKVGDTELNYGNVGSNLKVTSYIEQAKALAEAGNSAFAAALATIENLENYMGYADNYFNKGDAEAYASSASTEDVEPATRTNITLTGAEFYGTSLLLEDQVTIRHYFAVEDIDAFNAAYDVAGKYGTKGNFIYFDIADIPAQELGDVKTLSITNMEGEVVYEVTYSVTNYIVNMMNDDDANLVSLVNAMYDYYLAAADYAK